MTVDIGNLLDLVDGGVTQPVKSETLESVIPPTCAAPTASGTPWLPRAVRERRKPGILPL